MKRILSLTILVFAGMLLFNACKKDENPRIPALERVPLPYLTKDTSADVLIQDPATFKGKFSVDVFFKSDVKPKKMDVVVILNDDVTNIKTLKADITAFPTAIDVTANDLAGLFGKTAADIQTGDAFTVGANITTNDGFVVPAFRNDSAEANSYGGDAQNYDGASLTIQYKKVCPLDVNGLVGSFTMDDPQFWGGAYPVTTTLSGNELTLHNWIEVPTAMLKMTINEKTQTVTVAKQLTLADGYGYHNWTTVGTGDIDACSNSITLKLTNTVDEGSFGTATMTMHK
jgi:hypothetical protein